MILLIIIALILLLIIIFSIVSPIKKKHTYIDNLKKALTENNIDFILSNSQNNFYDYVLKINNIDYLLKLINIPSYSVVQINNKTTWEIKYGAGPNVGKAEPYKKYLNNLSSFMNLATTDNEKKVIILVPNAKKIVMYINECEIVFVDAQKSVYGARVINETDYSLFTNKNQKR